MLYQHSNDVIKVILNDEILKEKLTPQEMELLSIRLIRLRINTIYDVKTYIEQGFDKFKSSEYNTTDEDLL